MSAPRPTRWERLLATAPLRAGLLAIIVLSIVYGRFLSDDANILLAFADSLVRDGQPALNPGQPVHAISTPLWFGLAWAIRLVQDDPASALIGLRIASTLCALACVVLLVALVRRHGGTPGIELLAVILLVSDPWFGRWATAGMEAPAAAAVVLGGLLLRSSERDLSRVAAPLLVLSAGVLLRPELGILGLLLLAELVLVRRHVLARLSPARTGVLSLLATAPLAGWLTLSRAWFGTVVPQTALVKADAMSSAEAAWRAAQVVVAGQAVALGLLAIGFVLARRGVTGVEAGEGDAGRQAGGTDEGATGRRPTIALLLCWPALLVLFYLLRGHEPLSRYLLPGTVCLPAAAALAIGKLDRRLLVGAAAAALLLGGAISATRVVPASSGDTVRFYAEVADWMADNAVPTDAIASWEIGTLALHGENEVIDLVGLVLPPELLDLRGTPELLEQTRPRFSLARLDVDGASWTPRLRQTLNRSDVAGGRAPVELILWELTWQ